MSRQRWSGADLRETMEQTYPRPGWRVRNLQADSGRVYDFTGYRDMRAIVEVDWQERCTIGYFRGEQVLLRQHVDSLAFDQCCAAVEDRCAAALNPEESVA